MNTGENSVRQDLMMQFLMGQNRKDLRGPNRHQEMNERLMTFFRPPEDQPTIDVPYTSQGPVDASTMPPAPNGFILVSGIFFPKSKDGHMAHTVAAAPSLKGYVSLGPWYFSKSAVLAVYTLAYFAHLPDGTPVVTKATTIDLSNGDRVTVGDTIAEVLKQF